MKEFLKLTWFEIKMTIEELFWMLKELKITKEILCWHDWEVIDEETTWSNYVSITKECKKCGKKKTVYYW